MPKIRLLEISGSPFQMGHQHGLAYPQEIKELAEDRLHLSSSKHWTGKQLSRQEVLSLAEACLSYHQAYAPELMDELRGTSQATGVGLAELVILNGFTDFIDTGFEAVIVSANDELIDKGWVGQRLDRKFLSYLKTRNVDLCGENGEYHTLVVNGPLFKRRIEIVESKTINRDNRWLLDTVKYRLV